MKINSSKAKKKSQNIPHLYFETLNNIYIAILAILFFLKFEQFLN